MNHSRIIVLGFGPAGIACAIQLKRMGLHPFVIERQRPGGMLHNAGLIENYPGFPGGIQGERLAGIMEKQAARFELKPVQDRIDKVTCRNRIFTLSGEKSNYSCDILVIATGTDPIIPDDFPAVLAQRGFIHTDISGLRNSRGKTIGIIGAGDAAFDYAISLAGSGKNRIHIFHRGDRIKALKVLQERVFSNPWISYQENCCLKSLIIDENVRLRATFGLNMQVTEFIMDYLIFATGRSPAIKFISPELETQLMGLQEEHRLYLIGDVKNGIFRQLSVAVGDGVRAAMEIFRNESNQ